MTRHDSPGDEDSMTIRVVGIGNAWAGDDGVGPEIVRQLAERLAEEPRACGRTIECLTLALPPTGLLDLVEGCDRLIVVDAMVSGAEPGALHRLAWRPGSLDARGVARASSHGLGVAEVIELAAALGRRPPRVELWGIEAASSAPGEGLSPPVAARAPEIVTQLYDELMSAPV